MANRWLIGGAVFLGVLLVASIAVALLAGEEPPPEGTPEATVRHFLEALEDEDYELAHGFLSGELKEECTVEKFAGGNISMKDRLEDERVTLEGTSTVKDTVFVTVRVTRFRGGGPFGASESSYEQRFTLRREQGQWRFTEYPWPLFQCNPYEPLPPPRAKPTPQPPEPTPTSPPAS